MKLKLLLGIMWVLFSSCHLLSLPVNFATMWINSFHLSCFPNFSPDFLPNKIALSLLLLELKEKQPSFLSSWHLCDCNTLPTYSDLSWQSLSVTLPGHLCRGLSAPLDAELLEDWEDPYSFQQHQLQWLQSNQLIDDCHISVGYG